jgi:ribosomal protein S18 acetylase RimI-like enzyme
VSDIRRACTADTAAIAALAQDAYAIYIPIIGRKPEPITVDYAEIVAAGDTWVITDADRVVASLVLRDGGDHLLIWSIAVAGECQHQGLGRRLLDWAQTQARARGRPELRLYTNERMTRNIAIYERHGYTKTGREQRGDRVLVHMSKRLPPPPEPVP